MAGVFGSNVFAQIKISCYKSAAASTNLSPASNAVDCNGSSRWESNHNVDQQWIYVNLGAPSPISRVLLNWETASARDYVVEGSNDASFTTKTTLATRSNMSYGARTDDITGLSGTYQYIRMYGTARTTQWGYSLFEFEVYDAPSTQYTLSTTVAPANTGSVTPSSGRYSAGTSVSLTATPIANYHFENWSGDASGTTASANVVMNGNRSVTANFAPNITTYTLSTSVLPSGAGTVTLNPAGGSYNAGTVVTATANFNSGYSFVNWSGASSSTSSSIQLTMNGNYSLTANFQLVQTNSWLSNGTNLYYNNGNVGIGTNSPTSKLSVLGDVNCSAVRIVQSPAFATLEPNRLLVGAVGGLTEIVGQTVTTGNVVASNKIQADTLQCNALKIIGGASDVLIDIDGNEYHTVTIGTQTWTVENLRTTRLNDGTAIPNVTDDAAWSALTTPGYCWYNNDRAANCATFGALYNWYAVNTGRLAPAGWHVPTNNDFVVLENYLIMHGYNYDGTKSMNMVGKSMAAKTEWVTSNVIGTPGLLSARNDRSMFSALPGGYRPSYFMHMGEGFYCWRATEWPGTTSAYVTSVNFGNVGLGTRTFLKSSGMSIRLVKDN
jgi:uncharacterized protein (TIGR02145 family)/uncharacterized repeat protein (TIGR02543 family)